MQKDLRPLSPERANYTAPERKGLWSRHMPGSGIECMNNCFSNLFCGLSVLLCLLTAVGCAKVGPDYVRPDISTPTDWNTSLKDGSRSALSERQKLAAWWDGLNDAKLSGLIARAAAGNLDLQKAEARVREARARRGAAWSDLFPNVDATGSATRSKSSSVTASSSGIGMGLGGTSSLYSLGFDAAWELDIFGGIRRSVEAADANLQYSREDWRDTLVSLLAEVALNYVDTRTYQYRIAVAESNLKSQEETYQLTSWKREAGLSDELAVQQARYNLENTRSQIPALRTGLEAAMNRIAVLLGEHPGKVHEELKDRGAIPVAASDIAVGVPADLLRRRPDIRKAERTLAAQTAKIGVAVYDLYPKLKLNGAIGLSSVSTDQLFSTNSQTFSFGPSFSWRILDAGAVRQNIKIQTALQEQYLIAYRSSVLTALEEVENALVTYGEEQRKRQALTAAADAAKLAAFLAQAKYDAGLADFTTVLEAQRSLMTYQDSLAQSEGKVTYNLVSLYKKLGGGWDLPDNGKNVQERR